MKKTITGLSTIACLLMPAVASALDTLSSIRDRQSIVIAYRESSPPFSYLDENKQPIGYAIDLCTKIVDAVKRELKMPNLKVQYLAVDTTTRFPALIEGKADLECGVTTNNAERRKKVAFTVPHFFSGVRALVRADSGIRNWPDLRDRTVVVTRNTTTTQLLNHRNDVRSLNVKFIEGADDTDSLRLVIENKADVFPMDEVVLYSLRANLKTPAKYSIIGDPLSVEPYAIMLRKDDAAFKKIVDTEMVRIVHDGEIFRLYDRWFMRPIPPNNVNLNLPMGYLLRDSLRFPTDKVGE